MDLAVRPAFVGGPPPRGVAGWGGRPASAPERARHRPARGREQVGVGHESSPADDPRHEDARGDTSHDPGGRAIRQARPRRSGDALGFIRHGVGLAFDGVWRAIRGFPGIVRGRQPDQGVASPPIKGGRAGSPVHVASSGGDAGAGDGPLPEYALQRLTVHRTVRRCTHSSTVPFGRSMIQVRRSSREQVVDQQHIVPAPSWPVRGSKAVAGEQTGPVQGPSVTRPPEGSSTVIAGASGSISRGVWHERLGVILPSGSMWNSSIAMASDRDSGAPTNVLSTVSIAWARLLKNWCGGHPSTVQSDGTSAAL